MVNQKTKQRERPMGCIIMPLVGSLYSAGKGVRIYIGVGLSALLVSTCRAMREPQFVERATGLTPRLFFVCIGKRISSTKESVDF